MINKLIIAEKTKVGGKETQLNNGPIKAVCIKRDKLPKVIEFDDFNKWIKNKYFSQKDSYGCNIRIYCGYKKTQLIVITDSKIGANGENIRTNRILYNLEDEKGLGDQILGNEMIICKIDKKLDVISLSDAEITMLTRLYGEKSIKLAKRIDRNENDTIKIFHSY